LKELQVNNLPLGVFIARVDRAAERAAQVYNKTKSQEAKLLCAEILVMLNIPLDEVMK
jgi:hypothetical protein